MSNAKLKDFLLFGNKKFWVVPDFCNFMGCWGEFTDGRFISLPYIDLPDMTKAQINSISDLNRFLKYNKISFHNEQIEGVFNFVKNVRKGDVVALQCGKELSLIGYAQSAYHYAVNEYFPHRIDAAWGYCHIGSDDYDIHIAVPERGICISEITDEKTKYRMLVAINGIYAMYRYN